MGSDAMIRKDWFRHSNLMGGYIDAQTTSLSHKPTFIFFFQNKERRPNNHLVLYTKLTMSFKRSSPEWRVLRHERPVLLNTLLKTLSLTDNNLTLEAGFTFNIKVIPLLATQPPCFKIPF
jgi:hypothetical protein